METIEKSAGITHSSIIMMLAGTTTAAISVITHTQLHLFSTAMFFTSICFGCISILKIANSVAPRLPKYLRIPIHWMRAMFFELLSFVFIYPAMSLIRFRKKYGYPTTSHGGKPILLVHGYCKNSSVWAYVKNRLINHKLGPIYVVDLGNKHLSMLDHVNTLNEKCAKIKEETGCDKIVLIGHSMGGVVCSLCALDSDLVSDVITIASPLSGTKIAKMGLKKTSRQMEPNSALTQELSRRIEAEKTVKFYHIGTKTDQLIIPSSSSTPGTLKERAYVFEDVGHKSILLSPRLVDVLALWLKKN